MRVSLRRFAVLAATSLVLQACGSSFLFAPEPEPTIRLQAVADGQVLVPNTPIVLSIAGGQSSEADRLTVTVSSADRQAIRSAVIDNPRPGSEFSLDLASMVDGPGQYRARFVLSAAGSVVAEKTLEFFVSSEPPRLNGIESRPSTVLSGSSVELSVEVAPGGAADPFLRWTENGRPFAAGTLTQGAARVRWRAPEEPGVYTIAVELFPVEPSEGMAFAPSSSVRSSAELYVSGLRPERSLAPVSSYWMLYEFDGDLCDATRASVEAEPVGGIQPEVTGEHLGYRITPPSGIRIGRSVIPPAAGQAGGPSGFTVVLGLTLEAATPGAKILASGSDARRLQLELGPDGSPLAVVSWEGGETAFRSGLPPLGAGERHEIALSLLSAAGNTVLLWFLDGESGQAAAVDPGLRLPGPEGETLIGGPGGFLGIVDEFGVYYREADGTPGPDPDIFARAMAAKHGENLLMADGFDGLRLRRGYRANGSVTVDRGRLILGPGSSLEIGLRKPAGASLVVEVVADHRLESQSENEALRLVAVGSWSQEQRTRVRLGPFDARGSADYRLILEAGSSDALIAASLVAYRD